MSARGLIYLAVLACLPSCTLALPFDAAPSETGVVACHDARDDDFDGDVDCDDRDCADTCHEDTAALCTGGDDDDGDLLVDCDDPSCEGFCEEVGYERCTNLRDDDGDDRADARDAECWPDLDVEIERCATVIGGDLFVAAGAYDGPGTVVADPTGRFSRPVRTFGGRVPITSAFPIIVPTASSTEYVAGRLDGTTFEASVNTGRRGFTIGLGRSGFSGIEDGFVAGVHFDTALGTALHVATVAGGAAGQTTGRGAPELGAGPVWVDISMRVEGTSVSTQFSSGGVALGAPLVVELPAALADGAPLRVVAEGGEVSGEAPSLLGSITVHRPSLERCGAPTPPFGLSRAPIATGGAPFAWTTISDVTRGAPGHMCAIGTTRLNLALSGPDSDTLTVYAYRSDDDGRSWTRTHDLGRVPSAFAAAPFGVMAYDAFEDRYYAAFLGFVSATTPHAALYLADSADCETWSASRDSGIDGMDGGRFPVGISPQAYRIGPEGHAIVQVVGDDIANLGSSMLVTTRSRWGFPGTWTYDEVTDASLWEAYPPPPDTTSSLGVRFVGLGRDEVALVNAWDNEIHAFVRAPGSAWREIPGLHVGPSHEPRAYDALITFMGMLVEDAPDERGWAGRMFYGGSYDGASYGWGWANVHIGRPGRP